MEQDNIEKLRAVRRDIWRTTRRRYMGALQDLFRILDADIEKGNYDQKFKLEQGIIVDVGNPHQSARLVTPHGRWIPVQFGCAPSPDPKARMSNRQFCEGADEILSSFS